MNSHFSDEQISSYFDGEASPEEQAEIERLLETSDEARREFDDYKQLSALLSNLPVKSAPRNLSVNVSRKLGAVLSKTAAASSPSKASQSRRSLLMVAGSLAAIAAVLLITVKVFDFGPNQHQRLELVDARLADSELKDQNLFDRELPDRTPPQSDDARQLVAEGESDSNRSRSSESKAFSVAPFLNKNAIPSRSAPIAADKPAVDASKPIATPQIGTANLVQQSKVPRSSLPGKNDSGLIFDNLQELKDADIGKMVTALEKTNAGITVVKLTVVDRQTGLKSLQVLLSRHKIPLDDEKNKKAGSPQSSADKSLTKKGRNVQKQSDRLVAVYVEASSRQLSAALGDLRNSDLFQKLHVRGPIQTAQLDRYSGRQEFSGSSVSGATSSSSFTNSGRRAGSPGIVGGSIRIQIVPGQSAQSAGDSSAPVAAKKPSDALGKSRLETEKLADLQDATRNNEASTIKELHRISRQLELSLSPEILTELAQTTGPTGRNSIGSRSAGGITVRLNGKSSQPANQNKNATKVLQPEPLKVLFILVVDESDKPNVSSPSKPADSSKKVRTPKKTSGSGAA